jgi:hypothetical protein
MPPDARPPRPPTYPQVERRRRRRGAVSKLLTAPLPSPALRSGLGRAAAPLLRGWPWVAAALVVGLLGLVWAARTPVIVPRHRPEALWFALAQARFAPPMTVEPGVAVVRGRFNEHTPAEVAVREAMHFTDDMVLEDKQLRVGDYDVTVLWLRIPGSGGHWLVLAWMEDSDLAMASFRFESSEADLTPDEVLWGNHLMRRVLVPEYFHAGSVPTIRLRAPRGAPPTTFGPKPAG